MALTTSPRTTAKKRRSDVASKPSGGLRAGIYTRLSGDPDGTQTATTHQHEDCQRVAADRGWEVVATYTDTDLSGFDKRVIRPDFERIICDIESGLIDAVMVWRTDRLTRQPGCLERFLDTCERHRVSLTSVMEPYDAATNTGLLGLRQVVSFASYESGVKSERVARKHLELAEAGRPSGGSRGFGYESDGLTVRAEEAALIREAAKRILSGETAWSVRMDFGERGVRGSTAGRSAPASWRAFSVSPASPGCVSTTARS